MHKPTKPFLRRTMNFLRTAFILNGFGMLLVLGEKPTEELEQIQHILATGELTN
jgi:hypothetical protein